MFGSKTIQVKTMQTKTMQLWHLRRRPQTTIVWRVCVLVVALACAACAQKRSGDENDLNLAPGSKTQLNHARVTARPFSATFYAPENVRPGQTYPVVIDLHGCDGVHAPRTEKWRKTFSEKNIGLVALDSFTGRHVRNVCDDVFRISPTERVLDVQGFLYYIAQSATLRRHTWFLMGSSHGGTTALLSSLHPDPIFKALRGIVAYYPWCLDSLPRTNTDLLILIGDADDWTPAQRCRDMQVAQVEDFELVIYKGATHSFDIQGVNTEYYGHRLIHHPGAERDSIERVLRFIEAR